MESKTSTIPPISDLSSIELKNLIKTKSTFIVMATSKTCGPCRSIKPVFNDLHVKYPYVKCYISDVDDNNGAAYALDIVSMPTFIFFKNGIETDKRIVGAQKALLIETFPKYSILPAIFTKIENNEIVQESITKDVVKSETVKAEGSRVEKSHHKSSDKSHHRSRAEKNKTEKIRTEKVQKDKAEKVDKSIEKKTEKTEKEDDGAKTPVAKESPERPYGTDSELSDFDFTDESEDDERSNPIVK